MGSRTRVAVVAAVALAVAIGAASAAGAISTFTVGSKAVLSANAKAATLSGTITCAQDDEVEIDGSVTQAAGRVAGGAMGSTFLVCTGDPQSWSVTAGNPLMLPFRAGKAGASVVVSDFTDSDFRLVTTTVNLTKKG